MRRLSQYAPEPGLACPQRTGDEVLIEYFGSTDVGKARSNNEDALLVGAGTDGRLFAVADGMGGHEAGEVASFLAVAALKRLGPGDALARAIRRSDRTILACRDDEEFAGMGTTVVALRFRGESYDGQGLAAEVAHVGDSRAYLLRAGRLRRLTEDHSLAAELTRGGYVSPTRAAVHPLGSALTQALGTGVAAVESTTFEVWPDDRIVLCSDGLHDAVTEEEISCVLEESASCPEEAARDLIAAALAAGGPDNVTVVVIDLKSRDFARDG